FPDLCRIFPKIAKTRIGRQWQSCLYCWLRYATYGKANLPLREADHGADKGKAEGRTPQTTADSRRSRAGGFCFRRRARVADDLPSAKGIGPHQDSRPARRSA